MKKLERLDSAALLKSLKEVLARERVMVAVVVACLAEVERRGVFGA